MTVARNIKIVSRRSINSPIAKSHKELQEKYHIRLVTGSKHYELIIASLREGIPPATIASHLAQNGWITVNEKVFAQALRDFRNKHPGALKAVSDPDRDLNVIVDPNKPAIDEYAALQQLLRVQQLRLGMMVNTEKTMGLPVQHIAKEVEITNKIIETMAKIRGRIKDGGASVVEEMNATDDLNRVKKDQQARDRLHTMVGQLVQK